MHPVLNSLQDTHWASGAFGGGHWRRALAARATGGSGGSCWPLLRLSNLAIVCFEHQAAHISASVGPRSAPGILVSHTVVRKRSFGWPPLGARDSAEQINRWMAHLLRNCGMPADTANCAAAASDAAPRCAGDTGDSASAAAATAAEPPLSAEEARPFCAMPTCPWGVASPVVLDHATGGQPVDVGGRHRRYRCYILHRHLE
jgi:hypothetical protein